MMNLSNAKVETQKYYRGGNGPRGQNFDLKLRVTEKESFFLISTKMFEQLGLENKEAAVIESRDDDGKINGVGLAILPEGSPMASIFQRRVMNGEEKIKGKRFSHVKLFEGLVEAGIADGSEGNHFMGLEHFTNVKSIDPNASGYFEEVKSGGIPIYEVVPKQVDESTDSQLVEEEVEEVEED